MTKKSMKAAVIVFPGSNCDRDAQRAIATVGIAPNGVTPKFVWHKESSIEDFDLIVLPGGFSFGDYLRTGAIARYSPVMNEVVRQAKRGARILGICNGFQILTEVGLLPGALLRNKGLLFLSKDVWLRVENNATDFTAVYAKGQVIRLPIAHGDGNYYIDDEGYKRLEGEARIVFRYCTPEGETPPGIAPNGAKGEIAGIVNETGNVLGMMPHPERLSEAILGGTDGRGMFESLLNGSWKQ
jgi:phosphoribosylformylglycinamidine synthase